MITPMVIGERVKIYRLNQNISQEELAQLAGISRTAVVSAEKGHSGIATYIAIMRALGRIDIFEAAFPQESVSPIQVFERKNKKRQRAYSKANVDKEPEELDW